MTAPLCLPAEPLGFNTARALDLHGLSVFRLRRSRWVIGGAAALALHAAVILAALAPWQQQPTPEALPAAAPIFIDLAALPVLPPPAVVQPPPEPEPVVNEAVVPELPVMEKPDAVLQAAPPKPVKPKPVVEKKPPPKPILKKVAPPQPIPPDATDATDAPPLETASTSTQSAAAAPAQGALSATARAQAQQSWQAAVLSHLERKKRYPRSAQIRHQEGVVYVSFTVNRDGTVLATSLHKASEHDVLNSEALELPRRVSPVPTPPDSISGQTIRVVVPIQFFLK